MKHGKREMPGGGKMYGSMPGGGKVKRRLMEYMEKGGKLKMVKNDKGEMVPFFAADGKGKMAMGGKMRSYKMGQKGMEVKDGKPEVGDRKPLAVFVDNDQFFQVTKMGTGVKRMTPRDIFSFLDKSEALVIPGGEGGNVSKQRAMASRGIQEAIATGNMELLSDYVKPGFKGIEGFAVRSEAMKGEGPADTEVSKGALRK